MKRPAFTKQVIITNHSNQYADPQHILLNRETTSRFGKKMFSEKRFVNTMEISKIKQHRQRANWDRLMESVLSQSQ